MSTVNAPSYNDVKDNLGNTTEKARDTFNKTTKEFGNGVNNISSKARSGAEDVSSRVRSGADDVSSKVRSGAEDVSSKLKSGANDVTSKLKIVAAKSNIKSPLPSELPSEVNKAADILRCFAGKKAIPRDVIRHAKGLAIFTVVKAGMFWTGRAGSGIIVARNHNGDWSPPSCIGVVGIGFGAQGGIDVTNFVVVLNTDEAVKAFSTGDNVTLGGNLSISAGPIGMGTEFSSSIYERSALYSYSWSKGFFAGVSIEGTVIMQRNFANKQFYKKETSVAEILNGKGDTSNLSELYDVLNYMEGKESNDIISNRREF